MQTSDQTPGAAKPQYELSIVVPAYNEEGNVELLHQRLTAALAAYGKTYEILFVDDGSTDQTFDLLKAIYEKDHAVRVIRFARNFGQQMAMAAGLRFAHGDVVVLIDADMQTLPEEIPLLVEKLKEGYDIIYGVRQKRRDPLWRRLGSRAVSHMLFRVTGISVPDSASAFIALDRRFVDHVNLFNDKAKFYSGLFAWLSYGRCGYVPVTHSSRHAGQSKYNLPKLISGVFNFVCNFTAAPLYVAFYLGGLIALAGLVELVAVLSSSLVTLGHAPDPVWVLTGIVILLSGVQLASVGILGQYLARVHREVRDQPPFVIREHLEWRD